MAHHFGRHPPEVVWYIHKCVQVCGWVGDCVFVHMYIYIYTYIYTYIHISLRTCTHVYKYTYICIYTPHTHTQVIGEIYDEDDIEEMVKEQSSIYLEMDGSYTIDGFADLKDAVKALQLDMVARDLDQFGTLSGYLCHKAGCIPSVGTELLLTKTREKRERFSGDGDFAYDNDSPFKRDKKEDEQPAEVWKVIVTSADERRVISASARLVQRASSAEESAQISAAAANSDFAIDTEAAAVKEESTTVFRDRD